MFDMSVFIVLLTLAVVANSLAIPKIIDFSASYSNLRELKMLQFSVLTRSLLISIGASAIGAYNAPRVGLSTPFITSLLRMEEPLGVLVDQLLPALTICVFVLLGAMILNGAFKHHYRTIFQYFSIPLRLRVLQEGIVEEIVFRWGLMSVIARIINVEFIADRDAALTVAIVLAALASSLAHTSTLISFSFDHIASKLSSLLLVNFWAALCYGWLFSRYGLTASIFCHVLVVIVAAYSDRIKSFFTREESGWTV